MLNKIFWCYQLLAASARRAIKRSCASEAIQKKPPKRGKYKNEVQVELGNGKNNSIPDFSRHGKKIMAAAVSGHGFARRASPFSSFIDIPISGASKSIKILQVAFRDLETGEIFFTAPPGNIPDVYPLAPLSLDMTERSGLTFRYQMPPSFLNVTVMGVSLRFVADRQFVPNLSCIENYYYNNNLIGSFEFMFGQATCGSVLNWDLVYNLASTMASLRTLVHPTAQLIDLQADTFILTGSELIAHNKVILSIRWPKG